MASTYTVNIGIEKPGTGDQSGTWGVTTNTNFDIIDQATNGVATVTLAAAGTSGSPNTLQINNGALSDGRNRFIEFNDGADLGATAYVQLDPNDAEKIVHIRNSLSASRSLILFQGTYNASNDFEVPNGADVLVKFDGGGASATVTDVNANLTPTKITTSDADINGGNIDGTIIGAASAAEITGTTLNATGDTSAGDNAAIGYTSAEGLILTGQGSTSDITLKNDADATVFSVPTGTDDILFPDGARAMFGAGSDLQIYHDSSNSYIKDAGVGGLIVQASTSVSLQGTNTTNLATFFEGGAVTLYHSNAAKLATTSTGINVTGTVTADLLTVDGTGASSFTSTNTTPLQINGASIPTLRVNNTGGSVSTDVRATTTEGLIRTSTNHPLVFGTNQTERMRLGAGGNFVFNEDSADVDFRVESNNNANILFIDGSADTVNIGNTVDFGGILNVNGGLNTKQAVFTSTNNRGIALSTASRGGQNDGIAIVDAQDTEGTGGRLELHTAGAERARFENSGIVFNESGADADFRVESVSNISMLLVDAGNNAVNIGNNDNSGGDLNVIGTVTGNGVASNHTLAISSGNQYGSTSAIKNMRLDFVGYRDGVGDNGIKARINAREVTASTRESILTFNVNDSGGNLFEFLKANSQAVTFNDGSRDLNFYIEGNNNAATFYVDAGNDQVQFGTAITEVTKIWFSGLASNDSYAFFGNNSASSTVSTMFINRHASDGQLIQFRQGNVQEGTISVSGNTVSYNGFSGRHESSGIPTNTPVGTVVSTIDALDVYPNTTTDTQGNQITHLKAGQTRANHPKVEVSTSIGDSCVYGVVSEFDGDGKLIVTSVGIGSIRVTGACSKGDLLESNGDGTAKVQSDDIIRSKTIGKVTIGNSDTGEKLVSCVMYCG